MLIMSRSCANQAAVWRKKSVLPGKLTKALLANVEFPNTTRAGRVFPSTGGVLGVKAPAMGSGPLMSSFSFKLTTRPFKSVSAQLFGEVRASGTKSEEHTSELQSLAYLVCRLLLEKKKKYVKAN